MTLPSSWYKAEPGPASIVSIPSWVELVKFMKLPQHVKNLCIQRGKHSIKESFRLVATSGVHLVQIPVHSRGDTEFRPGRSGLYLVGSWKPPRISPTSLGNPFQYLILFLMKTLFLMPGWNFAALVCDHKLIQCPKTSQISSSISITIKCLDQGTKECNSK